MRFQDIISIDAKNLIDLKLKRIGRLTFSFIDFSIFRLVDILIVALHLHITAVFAVDIAVIFH